MPTEMNELHRDLGALSAQVQALNSTLGKVEAKLERLETTLTEARGGWKTLAALAGLAGGTAGFIATLTKLKFFGG